MPTLFGRMMTEPDKRLLFKFAYNFGFKGMRSVEKFQKRLKKGLFFPAFMFISITNNCNLSCQGCWSTISSPPKELDLDTLDGIIKECKSHGSCFFGILGGEPLLHKGLFELIAKHPECYFILFTNGTLITDEVAKKMRELGNISPLISVEGLEKVSDERRGGTNVYERTMAGIEACRKNRLITGVATSVCKSNLEDLASYDFLNDLVKRGVLYAWYYIYRPVGPNPTPELSLSSEEIVKLRRFIVEARTKSPIMVVDAYWDHEGKAMCPAATGIAHHIGPSGAIEPCPPIQFACDNVNEKGSLEEVLNNSKFLKDFRSLCRETSRGCILMEDPAALKRFMEQHNAVDSSGRSTGLQELGAMTVRPSHDVPGQEIPEKSWTYKFAKKNWFFGFGAYG